MILIMGMTPESAIEKTAKEDCLPGAMGGPADGCGPVFDSHDRKMSLKDHTPVAGNCASDGTWQVVFS